MAITYKEYKELKESEKAKYINQVALNFTDDIKNLKPIDGTKIFSRDVIK